MSHTQKNLNHKQRSYLKASSVNLSVLSKMSMHDINICFIISYSLFLSVIQFLLNMAISHGGVLLVSTAFAH